MSATEMTAWIARASVLLVVGYAIARLLESRSASMAHRVLVVSLLGAMIVPLLGRGLPHWEWTQPRWVSGVLSDNESALILPSGQGTNSVGIDQAALMSRDALPVPGHGAMALDGPLKAAAVEEPATLESPLNPTTADSAQAFTTTSSVTANPVTAPISWMRYLSILWIGVAGLLAIRLGSFVVRLWSFVRGCPPATGEFCRSVTRTATQFVPRRSIRVAMAPPDTMPMACWLGRWIIIVPSDIRSWSGEVRNATLVHETGHIARRDAWADFLVQVATCVLWPHPLAWLISRNVRRLRERACDEWVLQRSGIHAKSYARSLVQVVQRCHAKPALVASMMAGERDFESRLRWLLSAARPRKARPIATALIASGVAVFGLAVATAMPVAEPVNADRAEQAVDEPIVLRSKEPTPADPAVSISGVVLDEETGSPIAGADVILRAKIENQQYVLGIPHNRDILARTKTDARGHYAFDRIGIPPRAVEAIEKLRMGIGGAQLVAYAEGKAVKWLDVNSLTNPATEIRLEKEADVSGVVVDESDQPVGNATLSLRAIYAGKADLDSFARDVGDLNLYSEIRLQATADDQGRFTIPNMPRDYRIMVWCFGTAGQRGFFVVDTGDNSFDTIKFRNGGSEIRDVYRTPIRFQTEQKAWIEIRVVDHDGNPVGGGGVEAVDESRRYGGQATVDENGTAVLVVNSPGMHTVHYAADPLAPMVGAKVELDIQTEHQPIVEIKLPKSKTLSGRVIDADTGHPVIGAYVQGNALAVTGSDGFFLLPMTPGEHTLRLRHDIDGYYVPSIVTRDYPGVEPKFPKVSIAEDRSPDEVVIRVARGLVVRGTVIGPGGEAIAGVVVTGSNQDRPHRSVSGITNDEGSFELAGLSPHVDTRVFATTEVGAAEVIIPAKTDQPWEKTLTKTVKLKVEPGITLAGRVVRDGQPVPGVRMKLHKAPPRKPGQDTTRYEVFGETKTDADGRYSVSGLKKGEQYHFEVIAPGNLQVRDWQHQSPYRQVVDAEAGETIDLPEAKLVSNGQKLSGVVVDPDGNPVPDIEVSARLASGGTLSRPLNGPPPWTTTDQEGKFTITNLPEERISLMAYRSNPAGGRIRYASIVQPELNAENVQIVLDPKLGSGVDDLDAD